VFKAAAEEIKLQGKTFYIWFLTLDLKKLLLAFFCKFCQWNPIAWVLSNQQSFCLTSWWFS